MIDIKIGNCLDVLKELPRNYFHTVTGHKGMHDQGNVVGDAIYRQECPICGAKRQDDQIGLELTPQDYVRRLVEVFRELRHTLREDGTVWLNLGDSYHNYRADGQQVKQTVSTTRQDFPESSPHRANKIQGLKQKDLMGIPWRVAFALQEDGWYLRQDIIWHKPNPMPESVQDRCTKAHEYIFLLTKNPHYYYDYLSIQEEATYKDVMRGGSTNRYEQNNFGGDNKMYDTRNKRSVWTINTRPYKEAHFAVFPTELIEPCIKAGCPEDGYVLDPFGGSGTTGLVADRLNRNATIIELNKDYIEIAQNRIMGETPLFTKVNVK